MMRMDDVVCTLYGEHREGPVGKNGMTGDRLVFPPTGLPDLRLTEKRENESTEGSEAIRNQESNTAPIHYTAGAVMDSAVRANHKIDLGRHLTEVSRCFHLRL